MQNDSTTYSRRCSIVASLAIGGCHPEVEVPPLPEQKISLLGDRFFDVKALSAERALVVGYRGKILETTDAGRTWNIIPTPTDRALYNIRFADAQNGWICGQAGRDPQHQGRRQDLDRAEEQHRPVPLRDLHAEPDARVRRRRQVDARSRRPTAAPTWKVRKVAQDKQGISDDIALAVQDPIFYDIEFTDEQHGWIVGEFGTIHAHHATAARPGAAQQESLLGEGIVDILDLPTFFGVHFVNAQEGIAAGLEGKIARTHDGGKHSGRSTRSTRRSPSKIRSTRRSSSRTARAGWSARAARC